MATLTIAVMEEDIRNGERGNRCNCPTARAVYRELSSHYDSNVQVNVFRLTISCRVRTRAGDVYTIRGHMPEEVCGHISTYDKTGEMEPFTFEIEIPD
jgi:hypothetical protein